MSTDSQRRILRFLAASPGAVTDGDVAAGAGVDVGTVRSALYTLMLTHVSTLEVREDGTLVYNFGPKLTRIGKKRWTDYATAVGEALWLGFSYAYKASLAVVLVTYTVAFVVIIIATALAASAASEDEGPAAGAFELVGAIFRAIFEFQTHTALLYIERDSYGYAHDHYEPNPPVLKLGKKGLKKGKNATQDATQTATHDKGFVASVYDFVLGPERVKLDPRAQHRELASFVRERGGTLSIANVQALSGLTRNAAEQLFARFVAEFDGEAEISDDGALYAEFPELQRSRTTKNDEPIVHYWNEYEAPLELTGNTWGRNLLIALLAGFNLVCSVEMMQFFGSDDLLSLLLGAIPMTIFSLFFAIPILRGPWVWWQNRAQHRNNIRKRLFKAVFASQADRLTLHEVVEQANQRREGEEHLREAAVRGLFEQTMAELGGDVDLDAKADLVVDVAHLRRELEARVAHVKTVGMAPVVLSTLD